LKRRGQDGPPRVLVLNKPVGPTSFDMVRSVRRCTGYRKVGHAGTLDPFASGVLILGLGSATRLLRFAGEGEKIYRLTVEFGRGTDSHDSTGKTTAEASVDFSEQALRDAIGSFCGTIAQRPPRLSAIHVDGKRAYELERRGELLADLAPREIHIDSIELLAFEAPRAVLRVRCGGGSYMRALARDLGESLGYPAHAAELVREAIGRFGLEMAHGPDELETAAQWSALTLGPGELFAGLPRVVMSDEDCALVRQGRQPTEDWLLAGGADLARGRVVLLDAAEQLVALAETAEGRWRLEFVLPETAHATG